MCCKHLSSEKVARTPLMIELQFVWSDLPKSCSLLYTWRQRGGGNSKSSKIGSGTSRLYIYWYLHLSTSLLVVVPHPAQHQQSVSSCYACKNVSFRSNSTNYWWDYIQLSIFTSLGWGTTAYSSFAYITKIFNTSAQCPCMVILTWYSRKSNPELSSLVDYRCCLPRYWPVAHVPHPCQLYIQEVEGDPSQHVVVLKLNAFSPKVTGDNELCRQ